MNTEVALSHGEGRLLCNNRCIVLSNYFCICIYKYIYKRVCCKGELYIFFGTAHENLLYTLSIL